MTHQRHPMPSARNPPNGAPVACPAAQATLANPVNDSQHAYRVVTRRLLSITLQGPALTQSRDVGQNDRPHCRHPAAANPGQSPRSDKLRHVPCEAAEETAQGEDEVCEQEAGFASEDVAELAQR